jgi:enoyl-CoA hydratase/carnithine racemase
MILSTLEDGVLWLAFNRTSAANSLNLEVYDALHAAMTGAIADPAVKCIVLTGEGQKAFCAGADLKAFSELGREQAELKHLDLLDRCFEDLINCGKPVVACVQAAAVGAGLMLAALCDEIVMSEQTWVSLPEVLFDMPTPIGAAIVSPRVSRRLMHRLVQLGERVGASECLAEGLVSLVAPNETLLDVTRARARALAAIPSHAYALNKQWMNQHMRAELASASLLARSVLEHSISSHLT